MVDMFLEPIEMVVEDGGSATCGGIRTTPKWCKGGGVLVDELNQLQRMEG